MIDVYLASVVTYLQSVALVVYDTLVVLPFRRLYFDGPECAGFGFWQGRPSHEICNMITGVGGDLWTSNAEECEDLLERKFKAFVVLFETLIYWYVAYQLIQVLFMRIVFVHPIVQKLEALSETLQKKECRDTIKEANGRRD